MKIPIYQIDAFTQQRFKGNPAAVCLLDHDLSDGQMQSIAQENNLAETAFVLVSDEGPSIRWFSPIKEVELCGHATLAAAYVWFHYVDSQANEVSFRSLSGILVVKRVAAGYQLNFPALSLEPLREVPSSLANGLGVPVEAVFQGMDYLAVVQDEATLKAINPNFSMLTQLALRGVCVTAPGNACDFVSRFFAPKYGIAEDPVTGSTHCMLTPYWAKRLKKQKLLARQVSKRGGELVCEWVEDRVLLSGQGVEFFKGEMTLTL